MFKPFIRLIRHCGSALFKAALITVALSVAAHSQLRVGVAVISDGPSDRLIGQQEKYVDELLTLTANEFDVEIRQFSGDWSKVSIEAAISEAYQSPDIDMLLVTGFVANQLAATRETFPRPTFLPIVLDTGLLRRQPVDGTSAIPNLNYLSAYGGFENDLDTLSRILTYRRLVLFLDGELSAAIPELRNNALEVSRQKGIELIEITHDGSDHDLMARVPMNTDAVVVAGLPRMPAESFAQLVESINSMGLPSYSFAGVADVERGLLATNSEPKDVDRQARFNALNMQAVMLGGRAEDQPITSQTRDQLTINLATARRIGLSPPFDVLSDAVVLNQDVQVAGKQFGLVAVAKLAIQENQDLQAERFGLQAGLVEISRARSSLLPQINASASHTLRKVSPTVEAGLFSERTTDATFNVDQLIYSDAAIANLTIQKELQNTRLASFEEFQLDVVLAATTSYYTVLNAQSQLSVQENNLSLSRANLELARDRVRIGTSTPADVYRWQAELARAQILVLEARATVNRSWDTFNRILHQPLNGRLALRPANFDEPFVMTRSEFDALVRSPADFERFSRFYIDRALGQAPELEQLDSQIAAKRRELVNRQRSYWLPDFSIGGRYTDNLNQSGSGAGLIAGQNLNDWSVGVQATLPLFSGGLRRANVSRAGFELRQLETLRLSTMERVEEQVRIQLHLAQASYAQIDLARSAAEASLKNFELVSDAYARGTVSVIELLDAQDASLSSNAAAADSLHSFLITIMNLQRSIGGYDYLLPPDERNGLAEQTRDFLRSEQ